MTEKNQAQTVVEYLGENQPDDDKAKQDQIRDLFQAQQKPYFIVWGEAEEPDTGHTIHIVEEADLLMGDNSVVHIEAEDDGQKFQATATAPSNVQRFIYNALKAEMAARMTGMWFNGCWQDALAKVTPEWAKQLKEEVENKIKKSELAA